MAYVHWYVTLMEAIYFSFLWELRLRTLPSVVKTDEKVHLELEI